MKAVVIILIFSFVLTVSLMIAQDDESILTPKQYPVADSIFEEFNCPENTYVLTEENIRRSLAMRNTAELLDDIIAYSEVFDAWARTSMPEVPKKREIKTNEMTSSELRAEQIRYFKHAWHGGVKPIARRGFILSIEMSELARRYETKARPYLRQIAETELPRELEAFTRNRVKSRYQNPAAEAWLMLTMPEGLGEDEKTIWLAEFIENEKKLGDKEKKWAIEAAERMLRKMEREKTEPSS